MTPPADLRVEGELQSWKDDRGFGFLSVPAGGKPVFVHIRAFQGLAGRPVAGTRYSFEIEHVEGPEPAPSFSSFDFDEPDE